MANFKSDIITAKDQINISAKMVDGDKTGGLLLFATAIVTTTAAMAANDTIQLFDLPPQAVVVPQLSHVTCSADPGTTLTLDVGDAGDADRYADGVVLSSGGQVAFCSATMPAAVATPYKPTETTRIVAKIDSAASVTADVKLVFTVAYRMRG